MYYTTAPENQDLFIVPTNPITQTIDYNMRFLISDNTTNPLAWEVSKREDTYPVGITHITLKQSLYDPKKDNAELMIADYYQSNIEPENPKPKRNYKITYSSTPALKVGGSYKIFSIKPLIADETVSWRIKDFAPENYSTIYDENNPNKFKIKVVKNYNLIGTIFTLELYVNEKLADEIQVEVIGI